MATEAVLALVNLAAWAAGLLWLAHLKRTAKRQDAVALGVIGHYRPALSLVGLVLAIGAYRLVVQGVEPPSATTTFLTVALAGQVVALVAVDRWHRIEERSQDGTLAPASCIV